METVGRVLTLGEAEVLYKKTFPTATRILQAQSSSRPVVQRKRSLGKAKCMGRALRCVDLDSVERYDFPQLNLVRYKLHSSRVARALVQANLFTTTPRALMEGARVSRTLFAAALAVLAERHGGAEEKGAVIEWHDKKKILQGVASRGAGIVVDQAGLDVLREGLARAKQAVQHDESR